MLPSADVTVLDDAIKRAQAYLLTQQAPDGHWVGELEANTTITSEYLLLCRYARGGDTRACDRLLATFTLD